MSSLKIYFKSHNPLNDTINNADLDRSHLPIFYANNCNLYVSQNVFDSNWQLATGRGAIGSTWTYIDPCNTTNNSPDNSPDIGLLPLFTCAYVTYATINGGDDPNGVHKIALPPTTPFTMESTSFIQSTTEVAGTPVGTFTGLQLLQLSNLTGNNVLIGSYTQFGTYDNPQQFTNMTAVINQIINQSSSLGMIPFILLVNFNTTPQTMRNTITSAFPSLKFYPTSQSNTQTIFNNTTTITISNQYMIITNNCNINVDNIIPPLTPQHYNVSEPGALIISVENIVGGKTSNNSSRSISDFRLKPNPVVPIISL